MILPIVAYGDPILRKKGSLVQKDHDGLEMLIESMFETMYESHGVGLAAPQINKSINLFILDTSPFEDEKYPNLKKVFINAEILEETGEKWEYEEGCLSIPHIRENVNRKPSILIKYQDENFDVIEESFDGIAARVIQHEYDHIKGILFIDHITEFKKRLLKNKLLNISKGNIDVSYKMRFPTLR
ncbi:MAG: peptide deformylase [Bacteroidota bacterium]